MATYSNTAREVEMPNGDVVVIHNAPTGGANTTSNIKKFKYDDNGHVTESTAADAEDLNLSGYSTPTTGTTAIGTSDDIQTAIGKLDHQSHIDQTNILYNLNMGVKNKLPCKISNNNNPNDTGLKCNYNEDGTYTVIGTKSTSDSYLDIDDIYADKLNGDHMAYISVTGTGTCQIAAYGWNGTRYTLMLSTSSQQGFNIGNYTHILFRIRFMGEVGTSYNATVKAMVCTMDAWNQSHDWQPPALPNYDLTYNEAQDRAALAEEIDAGAKNKFQITQASTTGYTVNSDGTVTASGALSNSEFNMGNFLTGTLSNLVLSGCTGGSDSTYCLLFQYRISGGNVQAIRQYDDPVVINLTNVTWSALYVEVKSLSAGQTKVFKPMLCTKAAFGVSNKFVPYKQDPFYQIPINHNMIYRGRNLGATLTDAQHTVLSSGNFTDLYLGDYWTKQVTIPAFYEVTTSEPADWSTNYTSYYTKSGDTYTPVAGDTAPTWAANTYYERLVPAQTVTLKAVIADFDTFYAGYASSYAGINTHHAAVIVTGFSDVVWNKTNSTAGGYVNSLIHKWLVGSVLPQIETWFGSAKVLSHQKLLTNAITGDAASGSAWSSQKISLLSENQMYGSKVWGNSKASNGGYEPGEAFKHLNVFNHIDANLLFGNKNIWLRDIASAVGAAYLDRSSSTGFYDASAVWIAPAALILLS